jgi:D-amino-acid oxidase
VWIDEHSGRGITYIVPRSRDVVLGGTRETTQEDRSPDPELTREILARCARSSPPSPTPASSPSPSACAPHAARCASPPSSTRHGLVVHNYGHGGAGVTLSWGCAEAVRDLLQAHA